MTETDTSGLDNPSMTEAEKRIEAFGYWIEHFEGGPCACSGCRNSDKEAQVEASTELPTTLTEAIDWGGQVVDSGEFNEDGDMIIEYVFNAGEGLFQRFFRRLDWTEYEEQQVRVAFDTFETFLDVEFVETQSRQDAEFQLNKIDSRDLFLGIMNPPGESGAGSAGFAAQDGVAGWDEGDANGNPTNGGLEVGGFGFITLIHEFGHGLGLAHPHDTGGGSSILPGVNRDPQSDTGAFDLNQGVYTMMSYVDGWATNPAGALDRDVTVEFGYLGTPMAVDIALLQDKYGANMDHATGDDVYELPDVNQPGTYYSTIWDAGGTDELLYTGNRDAVIDLREASLLLEEGGGGWISYALGTFGGFTIANGVVIENATGGAGNDAIVANAADNVLTGNEGDDTFIFGDAPGGTDVITDFSDGDLVDLSGFGSFSRGDYAFSKIEGSIALTLFDQTIAFEDVERADLSRADFLLA